jgi:hypothetical protein
MVRDAKRHCRPTARRLKLRTSEDAEILAKFRTCLRTPEAHDDLLFKNFLRLIIERVHAKILLGEDTAREAAELLANAEAVRAENGRRRKPKPAPLKVE